MTTTHEFDDLLGAPPSPLAEPAPRRAPVTIDSSTGKVVAPTNIQRKASAASLRQLASEIVEGNRENMAQWINDVAKVSPKAALDILLQLMEFSTPRLKAVAMQIDDTSAGSKAARQLSTAELTRIVNEE